jgi:hypothetical protein
MIYKNLDAVYNLDLLVLIRNYKECIMSHLTRDDDQHDVAKVQEAFRQYIKVLEVFENSTVRKYWIYYEDLIQDPGPTIKGIANHFGYNLDNVLNDLDHFLEASRQDYIRRLGTPQTSGKEAVYFSPLTEHYDFDWDHEMYCLNPEFYDRYLKIYGEKND